MVYVLIFDLKGGNTAQRRRVNRYLVSTARRVQQSAWEFNDMRALETAAKLVAEAGGRTIAFVKSDRLLLDMSEVRQALKDGPLRLTNVLKLLFSPPTEMRTEVFSNFNQQSWGTSMVNNIVEPGSLSFRILMSPASWSASRSNLASALCV